MGNKIFKLRTETESKSILVPKEEDTLSIISDLEQKAVLETAPAPVPAPAPALDTVPIFVTSEVVEINTLENISESLSKSLPIDIPEVDIKQNTEELIESIEDNDTKENNNSQETASLSSISEYCESTSVPITEESDLGSDEDVLQLDE